MDTTARDTIVDKFFRNEDFVQDLYNRNYVDFRTNEKIGQGVFSVTVDGKEYAMKQRHHYSYNEHHNSSADEFYDINKWLLKGVDKQLFIELNRNATDYIYRTPFPSQTVYSNGTVEVEDEFYKEFIIGVLCSRLYEKGISANFIRVYDFATVLNCDYDEQKQCIFMERATDRIDNMKSLHTRWGVFIQTLHAIGVYQNVYSISHNDLQPRNILYKRIEPNDMFNGKRIALYDHFHYSFKGRDIYIPNEGYIVKIIDFDHSDLFGDHPIANKHSLERGLVYSFDMCYFLSGLLEYFIEQNKSSDLVSGIKRLLSIYNAPNFVEDILSDELFNRFHTKPTGTVLTLGTF